MGQTSDTEEVFGSPLESPSKFTSSPMPSEQLLPKFDMEKQEPVEWARQDHAGIQESERTVKLPSIQLTSHANLPTPIQSDSTNKVITSVTPHSVTAESKSTSVPSSPFVFSPPLTRAAARK